FDPFGRVIDWNLAVGASAHYTQKIIALKSRCLLVKINDRVDLSASRRSGCSHHLDRRGRASAVQHHTFLFRASTGRRRAGSLRVKKSAGGNRRRNAGGEST